jgi:putative transposase
MQSNNFNFNFLDIFKDVKDLNDYDVAMNDLYKRGIQHLLKAEMSHLLGYDKHSTVGNNSGNSRNGSYGKKVKTSQGEIEVQIPRDRNSEFDPLILPKGQTTTAKVESVITSLYAKGMSTQDVADQIEQIYGFNVSKSFISDITDKMLPCIEEWQKRPLEPIYYITWMDCICFKVRQNNKVINKSIYLAIGLKPDGFKEILGIWISETESASFWLSILSELKDRGVKSILIACTDNLTGFTSAIQASFPDTVTQLCIVHQIRNSVKFVPWKDRKIFIADLKEIYGAINVQSAIAAFEKFKTKWNSKYGYAIKSWEKNWENLIPLFNYPPELRKIMYTTNTIEGVNRAIRKFTKTKTIFPSDQAALKSVFMAIDQIQAKWTKPINDFGIIHNQILIIFDHFLKDA